MVFPVSSYENLDDKYTEVQLVDGMIIFPAAGVFAGLGGVGVSMFFVTYVFRLVSAYYMY